MEPTDSDILKSAIEIIRSKVQSGLVDCSPDEKIAILSLYSKTPRIGRYSCNAQATYYTEKFALWLKQYLDRMMNDPDKNDLLFECKTYRLSKNTINIRLLQSWLYLIDFLDPSGIYAKFRGETRIKKDPEGIRIHRILDPTKLEPTITSKFEPKTVAPKERELIVQWKKDLEAFLDSAKEGDSKEIDCNLTPTDLTWLKEEYFEGMKDTHVWHVTPKRLWIMRSADLAKKVQEMETNANTTVVPGSVL
jgi:hypothetical protein